MPARLVRLPAVEDEFVTVTEFARRVHRNRRTIYDWIRQRRMPPGTVFDVHGHLEISWTAWQTLGIKSVI